MPYIPLYEMSLRHLCKISSRFVSRTSFRRVKDIYPRRLECSYKTSLRRLLRCLFADWDATLAEITGI